VLEPGALRAEDGAHPRDQDVLRVPEITVTHRLVGDVTSETADGGHGVKLHRERAAKTATRLQPCRAERGGFGGIRRHLEGLGTGD
jgi:hypothetical protein